MKLKRKQSVLVGVLSGVYLLLTIALVLIFSFINKDICLESDNILNLANIIVGLLVIFVATVLYFLIQKHFLKVIYLGLFIVIIAWETFGNLANMMENISATRVMVNLSYVTKIVAPIIIMVMVYLAFYRPYYKKDFLVILLCGFGLILVVFILTNELHHWIFSVHSYENVAVVDYNFLHYVLNIISLFYLGLAVFFVLRTTLVRKENRIYIPFIIALTLIIAYLVFDSFREIIFVPFLSSDFIILPLLYLFLLHSLLYCGLIQNNLSVLDNFNECLLPIEITDKNGIVYYKTRTFDKEKGFYQEITKTIPSGYVNIKEDITALTKYKNELIEQEAKISKSLAIIRKERDIRQEEERQKERNKIISMIDSSISHIKKYYDENVALLPNEITNDNKEFIYDQLSKISLALSFMKEIALLTILLNNSETITKEELSFRFDILVRDFRQIKNADLAFNLQSEEPVKITSLIYILNALFRIFSENNQVLEVFSVIKSNLGEFIFFIESSEKPIFNFEQNENFLITVEETDEDSYRIIVKEKNA